jgi:uncharacterized protein (TIGR02678 family)
VRVAVDVPGLELSAYQKAVRTVLRHPLITASWPDEKALPLVRRFAAQLREDLAEAFGYRLELAGDTVRLVRARDGLDDTQPAMSRTGRVFDRRRYAYLALTLAVLGRAGTQVTLSELAEAVAADAGRIAGLGLQTDSHAHRVAFVDAVAWLEQRGALRLADGAASAWVSDPSRAEALFDIDRDVLNVVFRPTRVLQHVRSVAALLDRPVGTSENAHRRAAGQRARRAVVEQSVVYFADTDPQTVGHLRGQAFAEDLERLTGLRVERRAEGVCLIDTVGWSESRFPGTGAVAQVALLLAGEIADRIVDVDAPPLPRFPAPSAIERRAALVSLVDAGLPGAGVHDEFVADLAEPDAEPSGLEPATYPLLADAWVRSTVDKLVDRYGAALGEKWRADPARLAADATALLAMHGLIVGVPGGVLALPILGRYRIVTASVKRRRHAVAEATLFDSEGLV